MAPRQIDDRADLDLALGAERFLLFKHSNRCPISFHAFREYEDFAARNPDVPTGWIDVVKQRDWSRWVAESLGVVHQSPQALWVRDGHVAWHASHGQITARELARVTA
jgi:bacillithiol system protein YtxJ